MKFHLAHYKCWMSLFETLMVFLTSALYPFLLFLHHWISFGGIIPMRLRFPSIPRTVAKNWFVCACCGSEIEMPNVLWWSRRCASSSLNFKRPCDGGKSRNHQFQCNNKWKQLFKSEINSRKHATNESESKHESVIMLAINLYQWQSSLIACGL